MTENYDELERCFECGKLTHFDQLTECFDVRDRKWVVICEECMEDEE